MLREIIINPMKDILAQVGSFISALVGVVLILLVGWLLARLVRNIVTRVLKVLRLDAIAESIKLDQIFMKGGIKYSLSELLGILCYWLILLIVLLLSINAVGLSVAAQLLNRVILYIPNVIAGVIILVLGMFFATFLGVTVQTAASNAGIETAPFLGKIVEFFIVFFSIVVALQQMKLSIGIAAVTFNILLACLGLGLALAFGLGCKDLAGKFVAELIEKFKAKR